MDSTGEAPTILPAFPLVFKDQIASLPDALLEEMRESITAILEVRAERVVEEKCDQFMVQLGCLESCFAGPIRYTRSKLTKEQFRVDTEFRRYFIHFATKFSDHLKNLASPTALDVLKFLFQHQTFGIFVWSQDLRLSKFVFCSSTSATYTPLEAYLSALAWTSTENPLSAQWTPACHAFDEENSVVKFHASPLWLERICTARARTNVVEALAKIRCSQTLTSVYLAALHALNDHRSE